MRHNAYRVVIEPPAWKQLMALPLALQNRIFDALESLENDPRKRGAVKLKGADGYRVRVGDYRIIYEIRDAVLVVVVVEVGHRKEVYRTR